LALNWLLPLRQQHLQSTSAYVTNAVINQIVDELEVTAMGDTAHKFVAGLQSATFSIDFINDWAAGQVMQHLMQPLGKLWQYQ
jgi:hypothetical protein